MYFSLAQRLAQRKIFFPVVAALTLGLASLFGKLMSSILRHICASYEAKISELKQDTNPFINNSPDTTVPSITYVFSVLAIGALCSVPILAPLYFLNVIQKIPPIWSASAPISAMLGFGLQFNPATLTILKDNGTSSARS